MRKPKIIAPGSAPAWLSRPIPSLSALLSSLRPTGTGRVAPAVSIWLAIGLWLIPASGLAVITHHADPAAGVAPGFSDQPPPASELATLDTFQLLLVGDSITDGDPVPPGFRRRLYDLLNAGSDTYQFVGSSGEDPIWGHFLGGTKVRDHYPVSAGGTGSFDITGDMSPGGPGSAPHVVVIHLGSNNINSDPAPYTPYSFNHGQTLQDTATGDMGELHKYLARWANGTSSWDLDAVVLSLIIPINGRLSDVEDWNNALVDLSEDFAEGVATGTPIHVTLADHYSRFIANPLLFTGASGDYMTAGDDLHPNADGYEQMADVYRDAIEATMTDHTVPAAVTDLVALASGDNSINVSFRATGDNGYIGTAARYDLRYSTAPINAANFGLATQAVGEPAPGASGASQAFEVTGLLEGTTYYFAVKVVDDGGNRSAISNVDLATTTGASGDIVDDFNRPGPDLGVNWSADPEYQIVSNELANTSLDNGRIDYVATFVGMSNPLGAGFRWSSSSDPAGRNQAGLALRLDAASPNASGYLLYRDDPLNGWPNQWNLATIVAGGLTGGPIVSQPSNLPAAPTGGDEIRVLISSDAGGHHFDILVNGGFDVRVTDPGKVTGNNPVWYIGYMSRGAMNNNIDDYTVVTDPGQNLPPGAFDLQQPPDGSTLSHTMPFFDWSDSFDPDPGDAVTYTLSLSQDAGFPPSQTTRITDLVQSQYTWTDFLARDATYYWQVEAEDLSGATASSNQTWSFYVPNLLSIVDDFDRVELGDDWVGDPHWGIDASELANNDTGTGFSSVIFTGRTDATAVSFRLGATSDSTGFHAKAGFALKMDEASPTANGYMVYRNWDPYFNWQLATLDAGQPDQVPGGAWRADANLAPPAAGDEVRVVMSSDATGHHFDIYVRGQFDVRVTDPDKLEGNGPTLYAGYIAGGSASNNIDDFTLTGIDFNSPPSDFDLVGPPDGTLVFTLAPQLEWTEAVDPNPDDQVSYRVWYDTDPAFGTPDSLPTTTDLSTPFTGPLLFGESYYWKVRAYDVAGAGSFSNQTWSFSMADTLSVVDDFNRPGPELGSNWAGDSYMQIEQVGGDGELTNNATSGGLGVAAYTSVTNPDAVSFNWGANTTGTGIQRGGLALMLNEASGTPYGYMVTIDPSNNRSKLETLVGGASGVQVAYQTGLTGAPGAGSEFRVSLSSDTDGHHFDVYVNGTFHSRLTDSQKREGNHDILYAGVALRNTQPNNIDDFTMAAFNFGPPPEDFSLLAPAHDANDVAQSPELSWEAAGSAGMIYVVYVGTDSTFAAGTVDSANVQGDTMLVWPTPLELDTDYTWLVRATDGQQSRLNQLGWHRFRTTATPVELVQFTATGEVERIVLEWETAREWNHQGFHVWRSDAAAPLDYQRLTERLVERMDARQPVYEFVDDLVEVGRHYQYRLEAIDLTGGSEFYGPLAATALPAPRRLYLAQNVPNPFNPSTEIGFELAAGGPVRLSIYDIDGRLVRQLLDESRPSGAYSVRWDGRDQSGREVASGIYFSRLRTAGRDLTRKMMLVR